MTQELESASTVEETSKKSEDGTDSPMTESEILSERLGRDCEIRNLFHNKQVRIDKDIFLVPMNFTIGDIISFVRR